MDRPDQSVPLTPKEQALWLFQQYAPEVGVLNVPFAVRFRDHARVGPLGEAVAHVVRRHPALRTLFPDVDGAPTRLVLDGDDPRARAAVRVRASTVSRLDEDLTRFAIAPFDLSAQLPIRVAQFVTEVGDIVCVVVNHLVYDAYSAAVLRRELLETYHALDTTGEIPAGLTGVVVAPPAAPPDPASLEYWRRQLAGAGQARGDLAIGRDGQRAPDFPGTRVATPLSAGTDAALHELLSRTSISPNVLALAAYVVLLSRHGLGGEVVVAAPVDGRGRRPHDAVGYHVNIIALRVPVAEDASFRELVRTCQEVFLTGLMHAQVPVDEALPGSYQHGTPSRRPLLRYMFNYTGELFYLAEDGPPGSGAVRHPVYARHSRMDLELVVGQRGDGFEIGAAYATDIFSGAEVMALLARYEQILRVVADDFDVPVRDIPMWTDEDRAVVRRANDTAVPDSAIQPVLSRFLDEVVLSPGAPVLTGPDGVLRRADLLHSAGRLAADLRANGLGSGQVLGVAARREPRFLAAVLAAWAVGAAVLALDPDRPPADLAGWLDEARVGLLVGAEHLPGPVRAGRREVSFPSGGYRATQADPDPDLPDDIGLDEVACLVPAALAKESPALVRVTHRGLANMVGDLCDRLDARPDDGIGWLTAPADDPGWLEPLLSLVSGARLVIASGAPEGGVTIDGVTIDGVTVDGVTVVAADADLLGRLVDGAAAGSAAPRVIARAPLPARLVARAEAAGVRVVAVLGWPESSGPALVGVGTAAVDRSAVDRSAIDRSAVDRSGGEPLSCRPIANTTASVVDAQGRELPPGMRGSLCLSGAGVAGGSLHTGLTAAWSFDGPLTVDLAAATGDLAAPADAEDVASSTVDEPVAGTLVSELVGMWRSILGNGSLDAKDNFFANGGNSLLAARLVSQIKKSTGAKVSLRTVFRAATPAKLAHEIGELVSPRGLSTQDAR